MMGTLQPPHFPMPSTPLPARVLVIGAVGRSGAAVLRELVGRVPPPPVTVLSTRAFAHLPRGLRHTVVAGGDWGDALAAVEATDQVLIVVDALRHERDSVFWRPERADLPALVGALRERGVASVELVFAPGLAPLDSEAAALRQLGATLRAPPSASAQLTRLAPGRPWPERLAAWMLHLVLDTMRQLTASMVRSPSKRRDTDDAPPP